MPEEAIPMYMKVESMLRLDINQTDISEHDAAAMKESPKQSHTTFGLKFAVKTDRKKLMIMEKNKRVQY